MAFPPQWLRFRHPCCFPTDHQITPFQCLSRSSSDVDVIHAAFAYPSLRNGCIRDFARLLNSIKAVKYSLAATTGKSCFNLWFIPFSSIQSHVSDNQPIDVPQLSNRPYFLQLISMILYCRHQVRSRLAIFF